MDLYIAGFPGQSFSSLGRNEGFENIIKGTIYFYVYKTIIALKPKVFILENVKLLLHHNKGQTFKIIMDSLHDLNCYNISYKVLNTNDFGVPKAEIDYI